MRSGIFIAGVAAILALGAEHCQAQFGFSGGPYLYGTGYGLFVYERLPQYSLFPPVYYKHPVPRPYGFSPYAYPPGFATPDASAASRRIVVINNYVPQSSSAKESAGLQREPLVLSNPYVTAGAQAGAPPPAPAEAVVSGG
jgi:hypothetical protein